ncbi:pyridoxal phosphate-dependent aminotransferase [Aliamphritea hakodatensis]|uniref:pyridoxal phosphate-dependent aminotransferase n=1 Tax=Aliamphritea hakodatensis TaxID=2895352 RepID=UPI0035E43575
MYIDSKLPNVGTTIFTRMSQLAAEYGAINLSQGFPDFDCPDALRERVNFYLRQGLNQYAPMTGAPSLRQAIAEKVQRCYGVLPCADTEITVTSGATEAIFAAISAAVRPGDEVIVFDPAYDSYEPAIELNGGIAVHLPLNSEDFSLPLASLGRAISDRTRMVIINSPHNPSGAVLSQAELDELETLLAGTEILLLSDEVYEHIYFTGHQHHSVLARPALAARSFVVSSFGKTLHTTGWKLGYCVAPAELSKELRKVHQYLTFSSVHPMQCAVADYLQAQPEHYLQLPAFYEAKRDLFCSLMQQSRFSFTGTAGTYFQLMDYSAIDDQRGDVEFADWLTEQGVAAIPVSVFYQQPPAQKLIRFCFAKEDNTLEKAAEILCKI